MDDNIGKTLTDVIGKITENQGEKITAREVFSLLEAYPFFTLPAAELLKHHAQSLTEHQRASLTNRVAIAASNPAELYMIMSPGNDEHDSFYLDDTPPTPTTDNVIDTFLATYSNTSPEEEELLNRLIFNPTPDYSQVLAKEEEASAPLPSEAEPGSDDDRINRFIISSRLEKAPTETPAALPHAAALPPQPSEKHTPAPDSSLSESLARIFIKQRQFQRAYEIIEQLNLNFPEKSVYFADQLRFLRKLIAHQKISKNASR